ncbi:hypothetical protein CEW83_06600 [Parazoarcus communis]|uniref:Cytochrome C oxidase subunit IV n=1 Tax=Parazoarcus communis TaxID=41977 RepID=A0A2U8GP15_9RHOO|nr:cytochrome C oxidase subunit IV family protein [Parazoarcus communis]AWI74933.1 hypothetical protein CEW83_06600 [Parazoarcus communis]
MSSTENRPAVMHGTPRRATLLWAALTVATLLTWWVGEGGAAGPAIVALLAAISIIKGSIVILDFMALRHAPLMWRLITLGWITLVWVLIGLAYWKGFYQ